MHGARRIGEKAFSSPFYPDSVLLVIELLECPNHAKTAAEEAISYS